MNRFTTALAVIAFGTTSAIAAGPANPDPGGVTAGDYSVEPTHTRVQFSISHMGFTNWYGDFTGVSGTMILDPMHVENSAVDISIPVASISTTNAKLDGELKSSTWLDAAAFPNIHFVATKVARTGSDTANISGNLTFHGVTKPVVLAARFNGAGINPMDKNYTVGFDATTTINRSDYGVMTYLPMIGNAAMLRISVAFEKHG